MNRWKMSRWRIDINTVIGRHYVDRFISPPEGLMDALAGRHWCIQMLTTIHWWIKIDALMDLYRKNIDRLQLLFWLLGIQSSMDWYQRTDRSILIHLLDDIQTSIYWRPHTYRSILIRFKVGIVLQFELIDWLIDWCRYTISVHALSFDDESDVDLQSAKNE